LDSSTTLQFIHNQRAKHKTNSEHYNLHHLNHTFNNPRFIALYFP